MANHNASSDQLNLFNQPVEVLVEVACTVERELKHIKLRDEA